MKRLTTILLCLFISLSVYAEVTTSDHAVLVSFAGEIRSDFGFSSTAVSLSSEAAMTPTSFANNIVSFKIGEGISDEARVSETVYIYWKMYDANNRSTVKITSITPLENEKGTKTLNWSSVQKVSGITIDTDTSTEAGKATSAAIAAGGIVVYSDGDDLTKPRIGSFPISFKVSNSEIQDEKVQNTDNLNFKGTITISLIVEGGTSSSTGTGG